MLISELKSGARALMKENAPKLFFVSMVFIAVSTVMAEFQFRLPGTSSAVEQFLERVTEGEFIGLGMIYSNFRPSGVALAAVLWLIRPVVDVGYISYCMKVNHRQDSDYRDLLDGFLFFSKILIISVITTFLVLLGTLFFIFPGVIMHYMFRQAYYILLDSPDKGIFTCISESRRLMAGNKLDLFLLDLSFFGWHILNYLVVIYSPTPFTFPLILIWLAPYEGLARAAYFDKLIDRLLV